MKFNLIKRQLSIIFAGAILTLTTAALPTFAAQTSEQLVDNAATPTNLIAQRSRRPYTSYQTRCQTIRRIRRGGRIWLVQRCRRYHCRSGYRAGRRCRLVRTWIRRVPAYYRR